MRLLAKEQQSRKVRDSSCSTRLISANNFHSNFAPPRRATRIYKITCRHAPQRDSFAPLLVKSALSPIATWRRCNSVRRAVAINSADVVERARLLGTSRLSKFEQNLKTWTRRSFILRTYQNLQLFGFERGFAAKLRQLRER